MTTGPAAPPTSPTSLAANSPRSIRATLCYIVERGQVLLIRKKRGIGAGKINAPGGKVDPGEDVTAAAVRETQEETGLTPLGLTARGQLEFCFADGLHLQCTVFLADGWRGQARETAEAIPGWYALDALPYHEMWEDDRDWLPLLFAGRRFRGRVTVAADGQNVRHRQIEVVADLP